MASLNKTALPVGIMLAGNPGAVQQPSYVHLSKTSGNQYVKTFKGLYTSMQALFFRNAPSALEAEYQQDGAMATCKFTYSALAETGTEVPIQTLEVKYDRLTLDIFKAPTYAAITPDRVRLIRTLFQDLSNKSYSGASAAASWAADYAAVATVLTGNEMNAFDLLLRGVENWIIPTPVVTLTQNVSPGYGGFIGLGTVGQVWSSSQLTAYLGGTNAIEPFVLPAGVYQLIGSTPNTTPGWLREATGTISSNGNYQLIDVFTFGLWENSLYSFFA